MSKQVGKWKSKWENEQASLQTNECVGKLANKWDNEHMSWPMSKWAGEWANKLENEQMSGKMSKWAGKWSQDHDSKTWIVIWSLNCVFAAKFSTTLVIIITQTTNILFFSASAALYGILQILFDQKFINIGPGRSTEVQVMSAKSDFLNKWPPLEKCDSLICRGEGLFRGTADGSG